MIVKGTSSQVLNVSISESEFKKLLISKDYTTNSLIKGLKIRFLESIGVCKTAFLEGKSWKVEYEQGGGSHSWFTTDFVREATELEIEVYNNIHTLTNNFMGLKKGE